MPLSTHNYFGSDTGFLNAVRGATHTILFALCKLNEKQFEAPWNPRPPRCG
jgi:hypothetical protein